MRRAPLLAVSALSVLALGLPAAATTTSSSAPEERRYLVQFLPGSEPGAASQRLREDGADVERVLRHVFPGAVVRASDQAAAALRRNPRVLRVEADALVQASANQVSPPWGLDRSDQSALPLDDSYSSTATGAGVAAYVLDTGVRADHVDLTGRVAAGWTAVGDGRGTADCNGHGTHVAGTVAGSTHGIAKGATVVPVRVLDCAGSGSYSGVVAGLDWVAAQHAVGNPAVANLSLGGPTSSILDAAVDGLVADGVTVVVAAGNSDVDACTTSPARTASALTTGATTRTDGRASFSNTGSCLDLFAPGEGITSAWYTSPTATSTISGTSMAAPHVAGAAALLLESTPAALPSAVADALLGAATAGVVTGAGAGSPDRLLRTAPATTVEPAPAPAPAVTAPSAPVDVAARAGKRSATLSWTRGADGGSALTGQTVRVYRGGTSVGTVSVSATSTSAKVGSLTAGATYTFRVTATNAVGTSSESADSNPVVPTR